MLPDGIAAFNRVGKHAFICHISRIPFRPGWPCQPPSPGVRSAFALNADDGAPMGAIANLLVLVVCLDLESQLAPIHLEQLGAHRHLLALRGGSEMLDMHLEADGGV